MYNLELYFHFLFGTTMTIVAFAVTWLMRRFVQIMDEPNHRSSHSKAIPRAGGVSIVITFFIGLSATWYVGALAGIDQALLLGFVFSVLLISVISLIDDVSEQTAMVKLVMHMIAVAVVLYFGIVLDEIAIPVFGYVQLDWLGYVVSFLWILGLSNSYNFMDGLDGLAGGVAVIASLFFMIITFFEGSSFVYIISYSLLAGALGFLFLNYPPAKIILGDVGAVFLGFVFAVLAIIAARYDESRTSFLVMPLLLFNFIYDTSFTFCRRLLKGDNVTEAHRSHLYQLLNRSGYSHLEVVLSQYCMVFLQGLGALWLVNIPGNERMLVFIPFLLLQIAYTSAVMRRCRKFDVQI
jgi:UDP-GlcNAc:undecaprenyl-phosphate/decaprenyl-phosphate GlcNAc-1-phosphate transferase